MERLLNIAEVSELLGLTVGTLRQWVHLRKIPFVRIGARAIRFKENELRDFVDRGSRPVLAPEQLTP